MPRWLGRLWWKLRRPRHVRLHLAGPGIDATVEGFLMGVWGGHYILERPRMLEGAERTVALDGTAEVPKDRVLLVQVLTS
jgi:hypothetical protein